jgi:CHAD domain-containing protein
MERFIAKLKPAQEALGEYNDEVTALDIYRRLAKKDAKAWFAAGWLAARRETDVRHAAKVVRKLPKTAPV